MSKQPPEEADSSALRGLDHLVLRAREELRALQETRLYVQTVASTVLVAMAAVLWFFPAGPLVAAREAVAWVATEDYDFARQVSRASDWARARGGWAPAMTGLWDAGLRRVQTWGPALSETLGLDLPPQRPAGQGTGAEGPPEGGAGSRSAGGGGVAGPQPQAAAPALPVDGAVLTGFGWSTAGNSASFHEGIDLVAPAGSPVSAMADGTVLRVSADPQRGTLVEVDHGKVLGIYTQLDAITVVVGQSVTRGEHLGQVARATGAEGSLPPHLHFELHSKQHRAPVDPALYLGLGGNKL